jgi:hypothetical protein
MHVQRASSNSSCSLLKQITGNHGGDLKKENEELKIKLRQLELEKKRLEKREESRKISFAEKMGKEVKALQNEIGEKRKANAIEAGVKKSKNKPNKSTTVRVKGGKAKKPRDARKSPPRKAKAAARRQLRGNDCADSAKDDDYTPTDSDDEESGQDEAIVLVSELPYVLKILLFVMTYNFVS